MSTSNRLLCSGPPLPVRVPGRLSTLARHSGLLFAVCLTSHSTENEIHLTLVSRDAVAAVTRFVLSLSWYHRRRRRRWVYEESCNERMISACYIGSAARLFVWKAKYNPL